jgi:two-component system OmpR family response regulator
MEGRHYRAGVQARELHSLVGKVGPEAKVLVVDDEPAIRALVSKIVERAGFLVDSARDGAEAIEKIEGSAYDVVVVDLMMPNVDGYALIDYIRNRGDMHPAIIVITAGDSAALRQLDGSMVHSIVRKPFDIDVLGDLISAAARTMAQERGGRTNSHVLAFRREPGAC